MDSYAIIEKPARIVAGIELRTSNAPEKGPIDIPKHWEKFYRESIFDQIPNKASGEIIALYCDYEGDYTKPYSLVIGCPVASFDNIPKEMTAKVIPTSSYAVFQAVGDHPKSLIETWGKIWQAGLRRSYTGDFEVYGEKFSSTLPLEVEVCIALLQEKNSVIEDAIIQKNRLKFENFKKLGLPPDQFAITASGILGVHNLREMNDIDIIATKNLWNELADKYGISMEGKVKKIVLLDGAIEVLGENSFCGSHENAAPTITERIAGAEVIDGLPFESLEYVLYYKRKLGREKDLNDIFLLEKFKSCNL